MHIDTKLLRVNIAKYSQAIIGINLFSPIYLF
jgi:hypothetical protein